MENYEKKYKELVGKIEKAYLYAQTDSTKAVLEEIRSGLKESEDEWIRKTLLETFSNFDADGTFWTTILRISKDNVLDWLKKQNPVKFDEKDEKIRKELLDSFKYQQRESRTDKEWLNGIKLSEVVTWLEKQGESNNHTTLPKFTFDDVLALQCCMETVKKVQEDKTLYEQLQSLHDRVHDAYHLENRYDYVHKEI